MKLNNKFAFLANWRESCWQSLRLSAPLLLLGLFFECLNNSFFQPSSFFYQIFNFSHWHWVIEFGVVTTALSQICFSAFLLLLCMATAAFHIQRCRTANQTERLQSALAALLLLLTISYSHRIFSIGAGLNWLGGQATFLEAILVGLLGAATYYGLQRLFVRKNWTLQLWQITLASLFEGGVIREINYFLQCNHWFLSNILSYLNLSNYQLPGVIVASWQSILNTLQLWIGAVSPGNLTADFNDDAANSINLAAALTKNSLKDLPQPLNVHSLLGSYALLGGSGQLLALLLVLLLVGKQQQKRAAELNLFPVFFNLNGGLLAELPLIFNWRLLGPLLLAPLVSIWLATAAIALNILPPAVYLVPNGTPAILGAFLGTNGSWRVLIFTILLLLISMLIYYPFVKSSMCCKTNKGVANLA
ncbi:hypothetical protein [Liquorilactobacillus ghanensis]|jgi:cellobiose-specific phosphotransferase system component IIC|uniref:hypothetical protein n=1 Tax=Liquorilactobacillus ghanensis TaxID=399370 RepID=UPI0039E79636